MGRLLVYLLLLILIIALCTYIISHIARFFRSIFSSTGAGEKGSTGQAPQDSRTNGTARPEAGDACQYGNCEICGRNFTEESSSPDDCLH